MADLMNGWAKFKIRLVNQGKDKVKPIIINFLDKQAYINGRFDR